MRIQMRGAQSGSGLRSLRSGGRLGFERFGVPAWQPRSSELYENLSVIVNERVPPDISSWYLINT
jgi:hypothetical protein